MKNSKYFADRLSEDWPTCQILDSRHCVEVHSHESEFNFLVTALRLIYVSKLNTWNGVRNALGILQVADLLGCEKIADACVGYLEAVPWEEAEEEEILKTVPGLGSQYASILSRLQPVEPTAVEGVLISAIRFAAISSPTSMYELKSTAQEQLVYMLTEDEDAPLLSASIAFKSEVRRCLEDLYGRFDAFTGSFSTCPSNTTLTMSEIEAIKLHLSDLSWASQILFKMEMTKDSVHAWVRSSSEIVNTIDILNRSVRMPHIVLKVIEVVAKVLEAIGYGHVILPTSKRLHMVKVWLPFVQRARASMDAASSSSENDAATTMESEIWQGLESSFVSIVLALPSGDQADIIAEWLGSEHIRYPDLTEAFELWCYRSKVARRRMSFLETFGNTAEQ